MHSIDERHGASFQIVVDVIESRRWVDGQLQAEGGEPVLALFWIDTLAQRRRLFDTTRAVDVDQPGYGPMIGSKPELVVCRPLLREEVISDRRPGQVNNGIGLVSLATSSGHIEVIEKHKVTICSPRSELRTDRGVIILRDGGPTPRLVVKVEIASNNNGKGGGHRGPHEKVQLAVERSSPTVVYVSDEKRDVPGSKLQTNDIGIRDNIAADINPPMDKDVGVNKYDSSGSTLTQGMRSKECRPLGVVDGAKNGLATFCPMDLLFADLSPPGFLAEKDRGLESIEYGMQARILTRCI
ncbi:uncharacterized protein LAESUDRAFT_713709 [Laetiporus sulphureus 93-53]|uniref:Uncharacterized protein n=1 Tax=Laetiporus sulphureus 93-53 TaxID=1314785 RepID=A0A165EK39_9APHY|nr:uncharacterized protein LAESUDRAFT_713709 [Laetiporus sulphureus 93-53]KZT07220.1 hypothetical protein LAESUDRAFT_713709 [Laetiporus sulphureus 93-53]